MFIPPEDYGRLAKFPQFGGSLSGIADFMARLKAFVAGGMVWEFPSAAAAKSGMDADGAAASRVVVVKDDPAIYTLTDGEALRIGPAARMTAGVVGYLIPAAGVGETRMWSSEVTVPLGGGLDGEAPDCVVFTTLDQGGGLLTIRPTLLTDGGGDRPDITATRFKTRAFGDANSVAYTRYALWLAIKIGD